MNPEQVRASFAARVGRPCEVLARAPGRVNLIGEHTDYNEGYVLPIATEHSTWVAAAQRTASRDRGFVRAISASLGDEHIWPVDGWRDAKRPHWTSYVAGVIALLRERGVGQDGLDVLIDSDLPVGAGLSSSAALSGALAQAVLALAHQTLTVKELAALCRAAEHQFAGVPCGVMDQYASLACRADCALLLDCRSLEYEHVPMSLGAYAVLVVNSGVRHELAAGEYAQRQEQCGQAVAFFQRWRAAVRALRDVDIPTVQAHASQMDPVAAARARHVTSEIQRTLNAADALRRGDLPEMGRLMSASHRSLRDDYQVSCPELDQLVEIVEAVPGVLGARMTGGGFGGSIVALAPRERLPEIAAALQAQYDSPTHRSTLFEVRPGAGASAEAV